MGVELEIKDGDPCWLSPDIWVVPGTNPSGSSGSPTAGEPAYVWARVRNNGDLQVSNATVKYYWANPSTGLTMNTLNLIGSSYVSLNPGEVKEVLCLTQWVPTWVNNGHECLVVETFASIDPVNYSPDQFLPICTDRHLAQRNLTVAQGPTGGAGAGFFMMVPFFAFNPPGEHNEQEIVIEATQIGLEKLKPIQKTLNIKGLEMNMDQIKYGLTHYKPGHCVEKVGEKSLELNLKPGEFRHLALTIEAFGKIESQAAALLNVVQRNGKQVHGGITILLLSKDERRGKNG